MGNGSNVEVRTDPPEWNQQEERQRQLLGKGERDLPPIEDEEEWVERPWHNIGLQVQAAISTQSASDDHGLEGQGTRRVGGRAGGMGPEKCEGGEG